MTGALTRAGVPPYPFSVGRHHAAAGDVARPIDVDDLDEADVQTYPP